jgi:HEPN domain-containing protein
MTDAKAELVRGWLTKARRDLASARVLAASEPALLDTAIYHCQQGAEKAVKGYLVFCDQEFERVHDIEVLIRSAMTHVAEFTDWIDVGIQRYRRQKGYISLCCRCCQKKCDRHRCCICTSRLR